mmetsp:Transcript_23152/g.64599  ORF Transcript_23152/g.64599 Transcript_23152/m.64599 type:complete len:149 (-) Transcript_23152:520-966(-)
MSMFAPLLLIRSGPPWSFTSVRPLLEALVLVAPTSTIAGGAALVVAERWAVRWSLCLIDRCVHHGSARTQPSAHTMGRAQTHKHGCQFLSPFLLLPWSTRMNNFLNTEIAFWNTEFDVRSAFFIGAGMVATAASSWLWQEPIWWLASR